LNKLRREVLVQEHDWCRIQNNVLSYNLRTLEGSTTNGTIMVGAICLSLRKKPLPRNVSTCRKQMETYASQSNLITEEEDSRKDKSFWLLRK